MTEAQRPAVEFEVERLKAYLGSALPRLSGPLALERIAGGQSNPTFFLDVGEERFVLRKQPPGKLLPSAHAIDREFRVMSALAASAVPVPRMVHYCADASIIGTPFYLMQRLDGRVFHQCRLSDVPAADRREMYRSIAQVLAALHGVDIEATGLTDFGRPGGYFARQIARWTRQWELSRQGDNPDIERLLKWLPHNIPDDDWTTLTHGDFRVGNVLFHPSEPRVVAVLDWELSTLGHPLADLAHCSIAWHCRSDEYGGLLDADLVAQNLPSQSQFEQSYYDAARHGLHAGPFHMAFALFRFAVVFEGIAARAKAGNAADRDAANVGRLPKILAERAVTLAEGIG